MTENLATIQAPPLGRDHEVLADDRPRPASRREQIAAAAALIRSGRNVVIRGGRESGRTTFLRALVGELGGDATVVSASKTARAIPLGAFAGIVRLPCASSSTDRIATVIDQLRTTALLGVDDAELLDDESALVLLALAPQIPILISVNNSVSVPDAVERFGRDHASTIDLTSLDPKELLEIAEQSVGGLLDPNSLVRLCENGDGSPGRLLRRITEARHDGTLQERHGVWSYERRTRQSSTADLPCVSPARRDRTEQHKLGSRVDDGVLAAPRRATLRSRRLRLVGGASLDANGHGVLRHADALLHRGEPDAAARLLAPLLAAPRGLGDGPPDELVDAQLHWALAWSGRMHRGQHPFANFGAASPAARLAHARAAAELGDDTAATSLAMAIASATDGTASINIDALHLLGRLEMTRTAVTRMAAIVDSAAGDPLPPAVVVQVAHLRALGRHDGRGLEDVSACFQQVDHLAFAHEAMTQAAMMHLLTGSPRHAGRCRAEAEALAATGLRPTFAARRAVGQLPLLTRRERAVVERIAVGQTLRQVASELGCAPRTAESHLQHAYVKLGVNDRTALRSIVAKRA